MRQKFRPFSLIPISLVGLMLGGCATQMTQTECLSADFNCTVTDPEYVNAVLDRLQQERRDIFDMLLYVEQPFPYDLEKNQIEVSSVSQRKPLFLDESAHDWKFVALGRKLGWTGVALKTCKTQTGALLSLCWAKAHGMTLMVQDLTNPIADQFAKRLRIGYSNSSSIIDPPIIPNQ